MNDSKPIRVHSFGYGNVIIDPNDSDVSKRCPFQIVEDGRARWITLLRDIDFKRYTYGAAGLFHNGEHIVNTWVSDLYHRFGYSKFTPGDIIRNPTVDEMQSIISSLRTNGYYFNKKTNELKKIEEDLPF